MAADNYQKPYAEDYSSDDGQNNNANSGVPIDALLADASPGKANVRTKRSNPEYRAGTEKTPTGRAPAFDLKSDSGYSSLSVAGMSSADSAASATSSQRSPPVPPVVPSPTPAERTSRPTHHRQQSSQSVQSAQSAQTAQPPPRPSRRDSQRRPTNERRPTISQAQPKRRDSTRNDECTVPGCTRCGPDAIDSSRPRSARRLTTLQHPAESAPDVSHRHYYDTRSQVSDPAPYYPPSPITDSRPLRQYQKADYIIQPAVTRRPSVTSRSARPPSYHGDPGDAYRTQPSMHPGRGPPLSMSATFGYPQSQPQHPMNPGYTAQPYASPNPFFAQAQQMQPTQPYERPHLSARAPSMPPSAPRVGPVVTQPSGSRERPISARYPSHTRAPPAPPLAPPRQIRHEEEDDSLSYSEDNSEEGSEEEAPPLRPVRRIKEASEPAARRRPSMHRAPNTTPVLDHPLRRPQPQTVVVDPPRRADPKHERVRADRRKSVSRPPLVPPVKAQSEYPASRGHIIVESPRSDRRRSRQEYNMIYDEPERISRREYNPSQRHQNRSSKVYDTGRDFEQEWNDDDYEEEGVRAPLSTRSRRGTNADTRPRTQRPAAEVSRKVNAAENYICADRGARETVADQAYEVARVRSSRASGGPSEAESSRSRGSDKTNGEIRLRIGNDAPVTLSLNGDMEGRTVQLVPGDNGMNELVISGNPRGETIYRSEKSSRRRAITSASQAGRDAEDRTERSSQSSRRRREPLGEDDDPRRVLHRQMRRKEREETKYHQR